ncbi:MAG: FecR domain-containing protein [Bauldia sp.]
MMGRLGLAALRVLLLTGAAHLESAHAASNIGVASAAQNDVSGITGGGSQSVVAGSHIFQDEVIKTGVKSMAQLLFLDETSLSVGPQSEVTLDKFVYNPTTGAGSVVINATQGAFRFISGSQASANYKINTAVATIGTRGTIVDGNYRPGVGLAIIAQEGKADGAVIVNVKGKQYVLKPGDALFVAEDGTVTGPMAPDDEFFRVVGVAPWPLYGGLLPGEHEQVEVPDGGEVRSDDLFNRPEPCGDPIAYHGGSPFGSLLTLVECGGDDDPCDYFAGFKQDYGTTMPFIRVEGCYPDDPCSDASFGRGQSPTAPFIRVNDDGRDDGLWMPLILASECG